MDCDLAVPRGVVDEHEEVDVGVLAKRRLTPGARAEQPHRMKSGSEALLELVYEALEQRSLVRDQ